jgi:hypothetical protein
MRAFAAVIGTMLAGCQLVFPFDGDDCFGRDFVRVCPQAPLEDRRFFAGAINTNSTNDCIGLQPPVLNVCVVGARRVEINGPLEVQGDRSLVIIGDEVIIAARIDLTGIRADQPATEIECEGSVPPETGEPGPPRIDSGGGFGGTRGALGGAGGAGGMLAENGGSPPQLSASRALLGGCPGGEGGAPGGGGGGGGGAIAILASTSIVIGPEGGIDASGAGGGGGGMSIPGPSGGGGGGGAGGTIVFDALQIDSEGLIVANGGGGGSGGSVAKIGDPGREGMDPVVPAPGGGNADANGAGGAGGARLAAAQPGVNGGGVSAGGGGGGAVGAIIVLSNNATFAEDRVSPEPLE